MEKRQCKICGSTNPIKVTYNSVQEGFLCLNCYRDQFPRIPKPPRPIFLDNFTQ